LTHQRPFPAIPIPAAPENRDDLSRPKGGQIFKDPVQRVVRMGVINENGGLPRRAHLLQASGNSGQSRDSFAYGLFGSLDGPGRGRRGQDIVEVKPSQQRGGNVERFIDETEFRFDSLEGEPCGFDRDVTGAVKSVDESAARRLKADPPSPGVVAVEDHLLWAVFPAGREQFRKKTFLGLEVIFHRMVVVEMILRQVGKNPQIKCAIVYPPQVDGVRRDLRHDVRDAMVGHLPENPLQF